VSALSAVAQGEIYIVAETVEFIVVSGDHLMWLGVGVCCGQLWTFSGQL